MRHSWNIVRRVDVKSVCMDRGQFPLTYLLFMQPSLLMSHMQYAIEIVKNCNCQVSQGSVETYLR